MNSEILTQIKFLRAFHPKFPTTDPTVMFYSGAAIRAREDINECGGSSKETGIIVLTEVSIFQCYNSLVDLSPLLYHMQPCPTLVSTVSYLIPFFFCCTT